MCVLVVVPGSQVSRLYACSWGAHITPAKPTPVEANGHVLTPFFLSTSETFFFFIYIARSLAVVNPSPGYIYIYMMCFVSVAEHTKKINYYEVALFV